jgi:hypothetical protein
MSNVVAHFRVCYFYVQKYHSTAEAVIRRKQPSAVFFCPYVSKNGKDVITKSVSEFI